MAELDLDHAARLALDLPDVSEGTSYGNRAWRVGKKLFVWERPLRRSDLASYGDREPPTGPILGLRVDDLAEKEAVLQAGHAGVFTVPHFDGYPSVLVQLEAVDPQILEELVVDAWLCTAPKRAVQAYLAGRGETGGR